MVISQTLRRTALMAGASALSFFLALPAAAQTASPPAQDGVVIDELVVTAQRREERLQDVPIAVSAFSGDMLRRQKIDGGPNLQLAIPNVTFAKSFYSGYNFQIRGIGTKQTAVTGDSSTGVHFNGAPLTSNRLFEAEFFDVERVEVLRGPQGTLYVRNATGGVVNVLSAKPTGEFEGMLRAEASNYDGRKLRGMLNVPLVADKLDLRLAGATLNRSGFVDNLGTGDKVDDRDLYSFRASLRWRPTSTVDANFVWQHFKEQDSRLRTGKGLCTRDNGPSSVGNTAITNATVRGFLSAGCADASVYNAAAYGTPNSLATLYGIIGFARGLTSGDVYGGTQPKGLDVIDSAMNPYYRAEEDVFTLNVAWDINENLQLNSLTSYYDGELDARQEMNRFQASTVFNNTTLAPGGLVNDPQLGSSNRMSVSDRITTPSRQWSQELRLQSSLDGPLNFSLGGLALRYDVVQSFYIMSNAFTYAANVANGGATCAPGGTCVYIDPNRVPSGQGHGNYLSFQPYHLDSNALFGEVYYEATPELKFTVGLRYTDDKKTLDNFPVKLLTPGSGLTPGTPRQLTAQFKKFTGRAGFDWKPALSFTDDSLIYGFYSRGYKGGGPNNIGQVATLKPFYEPEYVNAFELGSKNTLLGGALVLNGSAFFYDYKGYQISKFVNRISVTENIDAEIKGLELEAVWQPVTRFRLNGTLGLLDTKIKTGESIDPMNRTGNNPNLTLVKTSGAAGCVVPTAALANLLAVIQQAPGAATVAGVSGNPAALLGACSGSFASSFGVTPTDGVAAKLKGNELPGSPHWTGSIGAQYSFDVLDGWEGTVRGDYYRQGKSHARVFNTSVDQIKGWANANLSFRVVNDERGLELEAYVKNLLNKRSITDVFLMDEALGQVANTVFTEPRIIGVSLQKTF